MLYHKPHIKPKPSNENPLKLPQISSRKHIQSVKRCPPPLPQLPQIKEKRKNNSLNKQNNSLNLVHRKNSVDEEIKKRVFEVEEAEKLVKNILGGPQATVNIGGDMTNFQLKIEVNRQILRKQRNKSHFKQQNNNVPMKIQQHEPKLKCVSSKQIPSEPLKPKSSTQEMKLQILQNHQSEPLQNLKHSESLQIEEDSKKRFKSERKVKNPQKNAIPKGQNVFKSIKQILTDPQKMALDLEAKKVKKMVKFTIEQLENKLRQMKKLEHNQSLVQGGSSTDSNTFDRKLNSAKSLGMIPISNSPVFQDYTFKGWNKIQFGQAQTLGTQEHQNSGGKQIKYHKSDFDQQVDQIQKLQMKSYKSIQKMVENRKLLIDMRLLTGKNKNSGVTQKAKQNQSTQNV